MKKIISLILFLLAVLMVAGVIYFRSRQTAIAPESVLVPDPVRSATSSQPENNATSTATIKSFEECLAAGKEITGNKPKRQCIVTDDLIYVEIETCKAPTGEKMNVYEATRAFESGPCGLEGSAKENLTCNETTGTWWVDIQAYRKGCNPSCSIDVASKKSEVHWNCK